MFGMGPDVWGRLDGGRTGTNHGDNFVAQLRQVPVVITSGVIVIPTAGMKRVTLKVLNAWDRR